MTEKAKLRSAEEEEALDRRIAEIRKKNEALERRQKEIEEDRVSASQSPRKQSAENASTVLGDEKKNQHQKKESVKRSNEKGINYEWSREWDHGKTSADTWIVNVPEMGSETMASFNRTSNARGGRGGQRGGRGGGAAPISNGGSRRSTGTESTKSKRSGQHDDRSAPKKEERGGALAGRLTRVDVSGKKETLSLQQIQDKNQNNPKRPNLNLRDENRPRNGRGGATRPRGGGQARLDTVEHRAKNGADIPKQNAASNNNKRRPNNNRGAQSRNENNIEAKEIRSVVDELITKATQLALNDEKKP